jgi:hypothetical protein
MVDVAAKELEVGVLGGAVEQFGGDGPAVDEAGGGDSMLAVDDPMIMPVDQDWRPGVWAFGQDPDVVGVDAALSE